MKDKKELIKALKLIHDTCESFKGNDCNWASGNIGKCPIFDLLGDCPQDNLPENWTFKEDIQHE